MCFTRRKRNTCISRPLNDAWSGSGDNIGFKKYRKKYIANNNGPKNRIHDNRIHPEPRPDTDSASTVKRH